MHIYDTPQNNCKQKRTLLGASHIKGIAFDMGGADISKLCISQYGMLRSRKIVQAQKESLMSKPFGISQEFLRFLAELEKKKEGEPFIYWQEDVGFLDVFIGGGECRNYTLGEIICPGVNVLEKRHPGKGEDLFVGFELWGGIQSLLQYHYRTLSVNGYAEFVIRHNKSRYAYHASEIFELWLGRFPAAASSAAGIARVKKALEQQNPAIHIPLKI